MFNKYPYRNIAKNIQWTTIIDQKNIIRTEIAKNENKTIWIQYIKKRKLHLGLLGVKCDTKLIMRMQMTKWKNKVKVLKSDFVKRLWLSHLLNDLSLE